jgi:transposase
MRFVELKSEEQLDVQTLHRVRHRLVSERTSLTNQIRSLLLERGHVVAQRGGTNLTAALLLATPCSRPWSGPVSEHGG